MTSKFTFCIGFSGITIRFSLPTEVTLPECFSKLICEDTNTPDAEYEVKLITKPLCPVGGAVANYRDFSIYSTKKGWLHICSALTADDGCQVACLLCSDNKHKLYYPASKWDYYRKYWHCIHLIAGEHLLINQDAFLLHSSVVMKDGMTVLFSGPSGIGKSTQAALWEKYADAEIINGDRCVIRKTPEGFFGGGSPWCGSSEIISSKSAPIKGVFLLRQGKENTVRRLGIEAFKPMFSQTTLNSWNKDFMAKIIELYSRFFEEVPVYELQCQATEDAVKLGYKTLFGKEI